MPKLGVHQLRNNSIYFLEETLANRIDFAWEVYSGEKYSDEYRKPALKFLLYALDITHHENINEQLIKLMKDRSTHKENNPEYIPGKSPTRIPFDPKTTLPEKTIAHGQTENLDIKNAIIRGELLDVNERSKAIDQKEKTVFLKAKGRAEHQVLIHSGKLTMRGKPFDSSGMIAHDKRGFAAFTLNANGELSVFKHKNMRDRYAHSSMNAGKPVVAAGEFQVEGGVVKAINTHSGHYAPSLFSVYRFLEHLSQHQVDISQTKVITQQNPSEFIQDIHSTPFEYMHTYEQYYATDASELYNKLDAVINKNLSSIQEQLQNYEKSSFTSLLKFKDMLTGSNLTEKKATIAAALQEEIKNFRPKLKGLQGEELASKVEELNNIIFKI
ncbi:MAG: hypothetical protein P1U74_07380 [Legionellaceae bacterium]|nr:hypothetical protein [Legionellaceae bacterium]